MSSFIENIKAPWNLLRALRLALALFLVYDALKSETYLLLPVALIFGYQAIWNTGCSAGASCSVPLEESSAAGPATTNKKTD